MISQIGHQTMGKQMKLDPVIVQINTIKVYFQIQFSFFIMPTWLENMFHRLCSWVGITDKKCAPRVGTMQNRAEGQNTIPALPPPPVDSINWCMSRSPLRPGVRAPPPKIHDDDLLEKVRGPEGPAARLLERATQARSPLRPGVRAPPPKIHDDDLLEKVRGPEGPAARLLERATQARSPLRPGVWAPPPKIHDDDLLEKVRGPECPAARLLERATQARSPLRPGVRGPLKALGKILICRCS